MRIDGLTLQEGATIENLTVATGSSFPVGENLGELFYKTGSNSGLYIYNGTDWSLTISNADSGSITASMLENSGATAGTYKSLTVTAKGIVTGGTNPTTLAGYGITDAVAVAHKGVANGVAELDSGGRVPAGQLPSYVDDVNEYADLAGFPGTGEAGKIYVALDTNKIYRWTGTVYIEISPTAGNADSATQLATSRTIAASGDATWSVSFNGSANVTNALTLADSGITAGTYKSVTIDSKGRATAGTNPTTVTGYGLTDATAINPSTPKDGDVKVEAGPKISIYAASAWRQVFPAVYS